MLEKLSKKAIGSLSPHLGQFYAENYECIKSEALKGAKRLLLLQKKSKIGDKEKHRILGIGLNFCHRGLTPVKHNFKACPWKQTKLAQNN